MSVDVKRENSNLLLPETTPGSAVSRSSLPRIETESIVSHKPTPDIEGHGGLLGYLAEN